MKIHKQQEPHWVWRFKRREEKLGMIMLSLFRSKTDFITDKKTKHCGIQLHPLNFKTGETSPSVTPYFEPTEDTLLVRQPACLVQRNKFFAASYQDAASKSRSKSLARRDRKLRGALSQELEHYRLVAKRRRWMPGLKSFNIHEGFDSLITHDDKKPSISIIRSMRIEDGRRGRQCHQIVHLNSSEYPDPARPSITELQVLISIIWDRMHMEKGKTQMKDKLRRYDASAHRITHHVVPVSDKQLPEQFRKKRRLTLTQTLIITMFPGAQVRVLYGYFDGKLKVQYTELQQVTTSNFEDMIGSLLKWSLPTTNGDTTDVVTLPTIPEEDEEEDEVEISPPKTIETPSANPIKSQGDECGTQLIPDNMITPSSFIQTVLTNQDNTNEFLYAAQLQSDECAIRQIPNNLTTPPTLIPTIINNQPTKPKLRYPTHHHSCTFYTCTVAAKNLVESRRKYKPRELMTYAEYQQRNMFEQIRKKNLASMKKTR